MYMYMYTFMYIKACDKGSRDQGQIIMRDLVWGTSRCFLGEEIVKVRPEE